MFVCLISYAYYCLLFLSPLIELGRCACSTWFDWMFVHVQCDVVNCYSPIRFFIVTYYVCLKWEFPWSYMYAQVTLLVHALSILNFDGLYTTDNLFPRPIVNLVGGLFGIISDSNVSFDGQSSFFPGVCQIWFHCGKGLIFVHLWFLYLPCD